MHGIVAAGRIHHRTSCSVRDCACDCHKPGEPTPILDAILIAVVLVTVGELIWIVWMMFAGKL